MPIFISYDSLLQEDPLTERMQNRCHFHYKVEPTSNLSLKNAGNLNHFVVMHRETEVEKG